MNIVRDSMRVHRSLLLGSANTVLLRRLTSPPSRQPTAHAPEPAQVPVVHHSHEEGGVDLRLLQRGAERLGVQLGGRHPLLPLECHVGPHLLQQDEEELPGSAGGFLNVAIDGL